MGSERLTAEQVVRLEIAAVRHPLYNVTFVWEMLPSLLGTAKREAEQAAEIERLRGALEQIRHGKRHEDNGHPLGEYASMAIRFTTIARTALGKEPRP